MGAEGTSAYPRTGSHRVYASGRSEKPCTGGGPASRPTASATQSAPTPRASAIRARTTGVIPGGSRKRQPKSVDGSGGGGLRVPRVRRAASVLAAWVAAAALAPAPAPAKTTALPPLFLGPVSQGLTAS